MPRDVSPANKLKDGGTVGIIGGGPAGAFLALHLLKLAHEHDRPVRIVIFERRRRPPHSDLRVGPGPYSGCPRCAGGVSPRLHDALTNLRVEIPEDVIQMSIRSVAVQGKWKPVYLCVPDGREMCSVFRGALPVRQGERHGSFDSSLIDVATNRGAELIGERVIHLRYNRQRQPVICYEIDGGVGELTVDFAAFAGGVNERLDCRAARSDSTGLFRTLQPQYVPPRLRKALIVELEAPRDCVELLEGRLHYLENSIGQLRLDMCSIMPKKGFFTITLIGGSVDDATSQRENRALIQRFLATPRIRRILPIYDRLRIRCLCNPRIVVGLATMPYGHRVAAVGDMVTSRQYKDGILAGHDMAHDLANVIFHRGTDLYSVASGYEPTLARFSRDNRYASVIFSLYRFFFARPGLSRILYQTVASERKSQHEPRRSFERIFWAISSGDANYEQIAKAMLRPSILWNILIGGAAVTLRNWLTELFFGLDWADIGRFPTAVPIEQLQNRRDQLFAGRRSEFECLYTIHIRAGADVARELLKELGDPSRPYLQPRWVSIRRVDGDPLQTGCTIRYRVFGGALSFVVVQEESNEANAIRYRVKGSFADGGFLVFLIEPESNSACTLSVYLTFDYARGDRLAQKLFWYVFRVSFPEHIHDVLWNHALCEFKQAAEDGSVSDNQQIALQTG